MAAANVAPMSAWQEPVTLTGERVLLTPLQLADVDELWVIGEHESIWRYMPFPLRKREHMRAWVESLLDTQRQGRARPFVTRLRGTAGPPNPAVGATCFLEMDAHHRRLEIGGTWVTPEHQRSVVNTEAKLLQMSYAFEVLGCNRVELKTDALNQRSRAAIKRIGGIEEGTFRAHMVMPGGRLRDSVYYSIIATQWPEVKRSLNERLHTSRPR